MKFPSSDPYFARYDEDREEFIYPNINPLPYISQLPHLELFRVWDYSTKSPNVAILKQCRSLKGFNISALSSLYYNKDRKEFFETLGSLTTLEKIKIEAGNFNT